MAGRNDDHIRCSFSNKSQAQVRKLIAGPNGVYICDACVDVCAEIIEEEFEYENNRHANPFDDINLLKPAEIKAFLDDTVKHAKEMGYVVTLFGRRRPVPELSSSNFMQRSFGERVAMNAPIQGTAADIMKIAMCAVNRRLKENRMKSRLVLQVHDELLVEAYQTEVEEVKQILQQEMEQAASLEVPLVVDMHTGENWYEAK